MRALALVTPTADKLNAEAFNQVATADFTMAGRVKRPAYEFVVKKLQEFTQLCNNWDSYGGVAPTKQALLAAQELMNNVFDESTPLPYVFPVPNGSVQIEWSFADFDLEVEVIDYDRFIVFAEEGNSDEPREIVCSTDLRPLMRELELLKDASRQANRLRLME